jgi:flagellar motor switch protein FliN
MGPDLRSILALEVPMIVVLAERPMKLADVVGLIPGAIIELPKRADEDLTISVANKPIGTGTAVKVGENFGVRINFIGDLKERIAALGAAGVEGAA